MTGALPLQERWLRGDTRLHTVLKGLPIFEAANAAGAAEPAFRDLHQCSLAAPQGMPAAALEDAFVTVSSAPERAALACLGVAMLSHSTVIRYVLLRPVCCTCLHRSFQLLCHLHSARA